MDTTRPTTPTNPLKKYLVIGGLKYCDEPTPYHFNVEASSREEALQAALARINSNWLCRLLEIETEDLELVDFDLCGENFSIHLAEDVCAAPMPPLALPTAREAYERRIAQAAVVPPLLDLKTGAHEPIRNGATAQPQRFLIIFQACADWGPLPLHCVVEADHIERVGALIDDLLANDNAILRKHLGVEPGESWLRIDPEDDKAITIVPMAELQLEKPAATSSI